MGGAPDLDRQRIGLPTYVGLTCHVIVIATINLYSRAAYHDPGGWNWLAREGGIDHRRWGGQISQNERTMIDPHPTAAQLRRLSPWLAPPFVSTAFFLAGTSPAAAMCNMADLARGAWVFVGIILLVILAVLCVR